MCNIYGEWVTLVENVNALQVGGEYLEQDVLRLWAVQQQSFHYKIRKKTVKMARYFENSTTYNYSWDQVACGYWKRYPNPQRWAISLLLYLISITKCEYKTTTKIRSHWVYEIILQISCCIELYLYLLL